MALRMLEIVVPTEEVDRLDELNEQLRVIGTWRECINDEQVLLRVLVMSDQVEPIIDALQERFEGRENFRVVVFEVEATLPAPEKEEEDEHPVDDGNGEGNRSKQRVAIAELTEKLSAGVGINRIYMISVVLSTVVAAIGLMRGSLAVIIGAMVIAPLLAPNMMLALATTLGDVKMAWRATKVNSIGLGLALALSILTGLLAKVDPTASQIAARTDVALSDVILALVAGAAGALAFTSGVSAALVGVMVAVALLPPIVASGLLLGAGEFDLAGRALLLTATNVIGINIAAIGTFFLQGIRPKHYWEAERARKVMLAASFVWAGLLAILIVVILLIAKPE